MIIQSVVFVKLFISLAIVSWRFYKLSLNSRYPYAEIDIDTSREKKNQTEGFDVKHAIVCACASASVKSLHTLGHDETWRSNLSAACIFISFTFSSVFTSDYSYSVTFVGEIYFINILCFLITESRIQG